jgi:hypothetical protein
MQLSALLDKIRGVFTPAFLVANVLPLLCFSLVNGLILGQFSETAKGWMTSFVASDTPAKTLIGMLSRFVLSYAALRSA